jgi:hypothetical protein
MTGRFRMIPIQKSPKREITQIGVAFTDHARIVVQNEAACVADAAREASGAVVAWLFR